MLNYMHLLKLLWRRGKRRVRFSYLKCLSPLLVKNNCISPKWPLLCADITILLKNISYKHPKCTLLKRTFRATTSSLGVFSLVLSSQLEMMGAERNGSGFLMNTPTEIRKAWKGIMRKIKLKTTLCLQTLPFYFGISWSPSWSICARNVFYQSSPQRNQICLKCNQPETACSRS